MVLDELWTALAGASGAALACCFVAAAVTLRWSRLRTARGAAARARQRQQAGLETMDKAAQRFRLQVTVVPGRGVGMIWGHGIEALSAARTRREQASGQRICVLIQTSPFLSAFRNL
jgi:hypothetical protein